MLAVVTLERDSPGVEEGEDWMRFCQIHTPGLKELEYQEQAVLNAKKILCFDLF